MPDGRGDFQRALDGLLAFHVGKIVKARPPKAELAIGTGNKIGASRSDKLAGALHLHFVGKEPALPGRRSAWPVRPLGLQVAEILEEAPRWYESGRRAEIRVTPDPSALSHGTSVGFR